MSESFSLAAVLGTLRRAVEVTTLPTGSHCAVFEVLVRKQTPSGSWFTTPILCKAWGRGVDIAQSLHVGQVVLFKGELAIHRGTKGDLLCISGYDLEAFSLPALPVPEAPAYANRN